MQSAGSGSRHGTLARVPVLFWRGRVLRHQAYRFELRPDGAQVRLSRRSCGSRRFVFNRALALQKERRAAGEKHLSYADLCKHLTAWKADPATVWLKEVHSQVLQ